MKLNAKQVAPAAAFGVLGFLAAAAVWYQPLVDSTAATPATVHALQFPIASAETARLAEVTVKLGDVVHSGQLLARLDTSTLEQEKAIAESKLREIQAGLGATGVSQAADDFATRADFLREAASLSVELESLKHAQQAASAERALVGPDLDRQRRLIAEGLTSAAKADELALRLKMLDVEVKLAADKIQSKQRQLTAASERASSWQAQYSAANARISQSRTQPLQEAARVQQKSIEALQARIASAAIHAPADGVVVYLSGYAGGVARSAEPFLILQANGHDQVVAYADARSQSRFRAGSRVTVARVLEPRKARETTVIRRNGQMTLIPERFWAVSTTPQYGFEVYIAMPAGADFRPGEALIVKTLAGDPN